MFVLHPLPHVPSALRDGSAPPTCKAARTLPGLLSLDVFMFMSEKSSRPKNKIGTPPLKGGILWTWVFLQKQRIFQAPIKLAQPFPAPELLTKNFTDTRISDHVAISRYEHTQAIAVDGQVLLAKRPLSFWNCIVSPLPPRWQPLASVRSVSTESGPFQRASIGDYLPAERSVLRAAFPTQAYQHSRDKLTIRHSLSEALCALDRVIFHHS